MFRRCQNLSAEKNNWKFTTPIHYVEYIHIYILSKDRKLELYLITWRFSGLSMSYRAEAYFYISYSKIFLKGFTIKLQIESLLVYFYKNYKLKEISCDDDPKYNKLNYIFRIKLKISLTLAF